MGHVHERAPERELAAWAMARLALCRVSAEQFQRRRVLGIIEASFGSTADFNLACRKILLTKLGSAEKPAAAHRQLSMIGDAPPPEALDC